MNNEGLTNKERLIIFGPIIIVIVISAFFFTFKQKSKDNFYQYVVPSEFHGVITEKYRKFNHAEPVLKYRNESYQREMSVVNWTDFFKKSEIGDSIYKIKGDSVITLVKQDNDSIYKFKYFFDKGWSIAKRKW